MVDRLLPCAEVVERVALSRVHLWRLVRDGRFPAPVQVGPRKIAFRESAIREWIDSRPIVEYAGADADQGAKSAR
jgi:prophage regulatory protein